MNQTQRMNVIKKFLEGNSLRSICQSTKLKKAEVEAILEDQTFAKKLLGEEQGQLLNTIVTRKLQNIQLANAIVAWKNSFGDPCLFNREVASQKINSGELWYDCPTNLRQELKVLNSGTPKKLTQEEFRNQLAYLQMLSQQEKNIFPNEQAKKHVKS